MHTVSLLFHDVYVDGPQESGFVSAAADRYKLSLAEFDAQMSGITSMRPDAPILITDVIDANAAGFPFLLTVDDGGVSYYTVIADRLEARGWRGHCLVTTDFIGETGFLTAGQIRELDARGHLVGTHSASHPTRFSACGLDEMRNEWIRSRCALEDLLGHAVGVASVPGGYFSSTVARTAADSGITVLFTSEPTTRLYAEQGCVVAGRFTVRSGSRPDFASRIVLAPATARAAAWASWNAKKLIKPLLGSTYGRVADWLLVRS